MIKRICFAIIALAILQGCEGLLFLALLPFGMEKATPARFNNNSSFPVAVGFSYYYLSNKPGFQYVSFPDTTLVSWDSPPVNVIKPLGQWTFDFFGFGDFRDVFRTYTYSDTLSFFIFNQDTIAAYPWEKIQNEYKVCARYDFSLKDANAGLMDYFSFPPTEKMKNIHMWPPYETILKQVEDYESAH